jgi:hypothetical protein
MDTSIDDDIIKRFVWCWEKENQHLIVMKHYVRYIIGIPCDGIHRWVNFCSAVLLAFVLVILFFFLYFDVAFFLFFSLIFRSFVVF